MTLQGYFANNHKYFFERHRFHNIVIRKTDLDQLYIECMDCGLKSYLMRNIPDPEYRSTGPGFLGDEADIMYGDKY